MQCVFLEANQIMRVGCSVDVSALAGVPFVAPAFGTWLTFTALRRSAFAIVRVHPRQANPTKPIMSTEAAICKTERGVDIDYCPTPGAAHGGGTSGCMYVLITNPPPTRHHVVFLAPLSSPHPASSGMLVGVAW